MKTPRQIKTLLKRVRLSAETASEEFPFLRGKNKGYIEALEWVLTPNVELVVGGVYLTARKTIAVMTAKSGKWWHLNELNQDCSYSFAEFDSIEGREWKPIKLIGMVQDFKKWSEEYGKKEDECDTTI